MLLFRGLQEMGLRLTATENQKCKKNTNTKKNSQGLLSLQSTMQHCLAS